MYVVLKAAFSASKFHARPSEELLISSRASSERSQGHMPLHKQMLVMAASLRLLKLLTS